MSFVLLLLIVRPNFSSPLYRSQNYFDVRRALLTSFDLLSTLTTLEKRSKIFSTFPSLFVSFCSVFSFFFKTKQQPNIVQERLVMSAVCPLGYARSGRGVQESRGRSWIDRRARYLHTADPAGVVSRQGWARDVLFILYIIVVVDFHLDTTNTLLFSPASLGR